MSFLARSFVKIKESEETTRFYWGCMHASLFVAGVLTFGFLDTFTAVLMIEKYGIAVEFNPLIREFILTQGITGFLVFKVTAAALILSAPLLLHKYTGDMNWTTAGFLLVFAVNGALAARNNYIFLTSGQVWLDPVIMIGAVLVMVVVMLQIGEIMDSPQKKMFKISDEKWERMKLEMGYPELAATTKPRQVQPKNREMQRLRLRQGHRADRYTDISAKQD